MFNTKITDRVLVFVLFIVMAVFSAASVITLRNIYNQNERLTNNIDTSRRNAETASFCVLKVSGQVNFEEIPYTTEAITEAVSKCFSERSQNIQSPLPPIPEEQQE